jgi:tetratricopeptide (TPR) repeat protein
VPINELVFEFDPETLREIVRVPEQVKAVRTELTGELDSVDEETEPAQVAELAGQRSVLSRVLDDLDLALGDGQRAVSAAERAGDPQVLASAQARLAQVYQYRGEFEDATALFAGALMDAEKHGFPAGLRASLHENAGKNYFEQGLYGEAVEQFEAAVRLRDEPESLAFAEAALSAARARLAR